MLILDATTKKLQVLMLEAITTSNPVYVASYVDITTTTFTPIGADGALNGVTAVDVVGSPASSTQRQIKELSITNIDTVPHTITVRYNDNGTSRTLVSYLIPVGASLYYLDEVGFSIITNAGVNFADTTYLITSDSGLLASAFVAADSSTTMTITSGSSFASYLGTSVRSSSTISVRYRVTTAAVTITWAEIGIFVGSINLGGNPTLTRYGYADVSAIVNSTGNYTTQVSLSTPISPGDNVWVAFGNQANTAMQLRAGLADNIQTGILASTANRISTVTSPTAWTVDSSTSVPWVRGYNT